MKRTLAGREGAGTHSCVDKPGVAVCPSLPVMLVLNKHTHTHTKLHC